VIKRKEEKKERKKETTNNGEQNAIQISGCLEGKKFELSSFM
jgi:hypothetical protein